MIFCSPYNLSCGHRIFKILVSISHNQGGIMGVDTKILKIRCPQLKIYGKQNKIRQVFFITIYMMCKPTKKSATSLSAPSLLYTWGVKPCISLRRGCPRTRLYHKRKLMIHIIILHPPTLTIPTPQLSLLMCSNTGVEGGQSTLVDSTLVFWQCYQMPYSTI